MCVHIGEPSNVDLGMCLHADAVLRLSVSYVSVSLNNPTVVSFLLFCAVCVCMCAATDGKATCEGRKQEIWLPSVRLDFLLSVNLLCDLLTSPTPFLLSLFP